MKIDDKIKPLRPYILSIRYKDEMAIIDVKLKENWKVPSTRKGLIGVQPYAQYPGTYMFHSDGDNIGVDDIIDYIEEVVKINIERERKLELLSTKRNELAAFFQKHSFDELKRMVFIIEPEVDEIEPEEESIEEDEIIDNIDSTSEGNEFEEEDLTPREVEDIEKEQ